MSAAEIPEKVGHAEHIPVRNLWLLMLYASNLLRHAGSAMISAEENPDDIPDLAAEILSRQVERRLKKNLSFGHQPRSAVLGHVRGRISLLPTARRHLLERGLVACRFDELTIDTPRNRFVRAALEKIAQVVRSRQLASRCRSLAARLGRLGVSGEGTSRAEAYVDQFGRHDADDRQMVSAAQLAFSLVLPTETAGTMHLPVPSREIAWLRKLYEKGVAGFYDVVLTDQGWYVHAGKKLGWPLEGRTVGIDDILPSMCADIVLDHPVLGRRIVVDTKFNAVLIHGWHREKTLRSSHLYQIYAYLRSQEGRGDLLAAKASGLLLHPSVGTSVNELVEIQGHKIRFATVDLAADARTIRTQLQQVLDGI